MQIATWLFVASTLAAPAPSSAPATPVMQPAPAPAVSFAAAQQRAQIAPIGTMSPARRFGVGGSFAVSNMGIGGSVRYWFSKHVGVSMAAGWYRPRGYFTAYGTTTRTTPSTVLATPGVMVRLNESDPNAAVSFLPYFGVGATFAHATSVVQTTPVLTGSRSTTAMQEYGGVEMFFRDHRNFALTVEGVYTQMPTTFVNQSYVKGFNMVVAATFYLK